MWPYQPSLWPASGQQNAGGNSAVVPELPLLGGPGCGEACCRCVNLIFSCFFALLAGIPQSVMQAAMELATDLSVALCIIPSSCPYPNPTNHRDPLIAQALLALPAVHPSRAPGRHALNLSGRSRNATRCRLSCSLRSCLFQASARKYRRRLLPTRSSSFSVKPAPAKPPSCRRSAWNWGAA